MTMHTVQIGKDMSCNECEGENRNYYHAYMYVYTALINY